RQRLDALAGARAELAGIEQRSRRAAARGTQPLAQAARAELAQAAPDRASREPIDDRRAHQDPENCEWRAACEVGCPGQAPTAADLSGRATRSVLTACDI